MSTVLDKIKESTQEETPEIQNLDNLSLAEIKKLALQEAGELPAPEAEEKPEPKRDEKGRFAAEEEAEETEDTEKEEQETKLFRKEIDLGDGSGVQVFEAPTLEELVDKLATAQVNATRKIRQLNAELKTKPKQESVKEKELSADEEFVISQEMMAKPSAAFKKLFKQMVGVDISEFRSTVDRMNAFEAAQTEAKAQEQVERSKATAAESFMAAHPDYVASPTNGARLTRAVNLLVNEAKAEGKEIDYPTLLANAYKDLTDSGLLELKSTETPVAKEPTGTESSRIEKSDEVVPQQRRRASSISSRGRVNAPVKKTEPDENELYSMPLDKLRELANKQPR